MCDFNVITVIENAAEAAMNTLYTREIKISVSSNLQQICNLVQTEKSGYHHGKCSFGLFFSSSQAKE
jgi:hypothetical protein